MVGKGLNMELRAKMLVFLAKMLVFLAKMLVFLAKMVVFMAKMVVFLAKILGILAKMVEPKENLLDIRELNMELGVRSMRSLQLLRVRRVKNLGLWANHSALWVNSLEEKGLSLLARKLKIGAEPQHTRIELKRPRRVMKPQEQLQFR